MCNIVIEFYLYSIVYIYLINSRLDVTTSVCHHFRTTRTLSTPTNTWLITTNTTLHHPSSVSRPCYGHSLLWPRLVNLCNEKRIIFSKHSISYHSPKVQLNIVYGCVIITQYLFLMFSVFLLHYFSGIKFMTKTYLTSIS